MRIITTLIMILLTGLLLFTSISYTAVAGEKPAPTGTEALDKKDENPLVSEADALLAKIKEAGQDVVRLHSEHGKVKGEEKLAVWNRIAQRLMESVADEKALVENIRRQQQEGLDPSGLRQKLGPMLTQTSKETQRHAKNLETSIAELREKRETASSEELIEVEGRLTKDIALLSETYEAYLDCIHNLEAQNLDVSEERAYLVERLSERAEKTGGRIEVTLEKIKDLRTRTKEDPDNAEIKTKLSSAQEKMERAVSSLTETIGVLEDLGRETAEYKQLLIQATGDITTDIFDTKVAFGLLQEWLQDIKTWAVENGPRLLFKVVLFLVILLVFKILARFTQKIVQASLSKSKLQPSQLLQNMFVSLASKSVILVGILIALSQLGLKIGPLLAGLGIAGFIIGFALQGLLSDFASGLMILLYRPFDVGDEIEASGAYGIVTHMSLVNTTLLTFDKQVLIVPNNKVWGGVIKNFTSHEVRRVDLFFSVSYSEDIPRAEKVLMKIMEDHEMVLDDPAPTVKVSKLDDSSVELFARPFVNPKDFWDVYFDIRREVKLGFDREGITIPFPQRDVHFYAEKTVNG